MYIGLRYFPLAERRAARAVRILAILSGGGGVGTRLTRAAVQLVMLPSTLTRIRRSEHEARGLFAARQPIPNLDPLDPAAVVRSSS